jgi:hypothetical protein
MAQLGMWWLSDLVHWVAPDCHAAVPSSNPASLMVSCTGPGNMTVYYKTNLVVGGVPAWVRKKECCGAGAAISRISLVEPALERGADPALAPAPKQRRISFNGTNCDNILLLHFTLTVNEIIRSFKICLHYSIKAGWSRITNFTQNQNCIQKNYAASKKMISEGKNNFIT